MRRKGRGENKGGKVPRVTPLRVGVEGDTDKIFSKKEGWPEGRTRETGGEGGKKGKRLA